MTALAHPKYYLAPHVRACRTREHVVFLDIRRNEYLGLSQAEAATALRAIADLFPEEPAADASAADPILAQLLEQGLLSKDPPSTSGKMRPTVPRAARPLISGYEEIDTDIDAICVLRFVRACAISRTILKVLPFRFAVAHVQAHRRRQWPSAQPEQELDAARLSETQRRVTQFRRLRPLMFSARNACLSQSFAMSEFLRAYGIYPSWIFGVATEPFAAHCWLQQGTVVINDVPENVRRFTPILIL
jgi:hypothetical protein